MHGDDGQDQRETDGEGVMDASRRKFLRGAVASIVAVSVPVAVVVQIAAAYGRSSAAAALPDARLIATLQRTLDRALNPPAVLWGDGTMTLMDNSAAWETLDTIYKLCEERGLVPQHTMIAAHQQVIGWSN